MSRNRFIFLLLGTVMISSCTTWKNNPLPINQSSDLGKEGKWISRYDSTQMLVIQWYKKGKEHGTYVRYHKNGRIAVSGKYKRGYKTGLWKGYLSNGSIVSLRKYRKGIVVQNTIVNPKF